MVVVIAVLMHDSIEEGELLLTVKYLVSGLSEFKDDMFDWLGVCCSLR